MKKAAKKVLPPKKKLKMEPPAGTSMPTFHMLVDEGSFEEEEVDVEGGGATTV